MQQLPESLKQHRVHATDASAVLIGEVHYAPLKSLWFTAMTAGALVGGVLTFTWSAFIVFLATTGTVLLLGHSLGSHRKLIHDSYQCPKWLEYLLVWFGVQVGLAGPLGLLRQHELRDYAQRLPNCHDYLRHGRSFWLDAWWQLHCELRLAHPPALHIEPRIANDRFYRFLERTWMAQQIPVALVLYVLGGWGFVFWGVCARVTAGVLGHWLIGWFAHNRGAMHYEVRNAAVQGRNIRFTSLLTMGESWHNNHHAFPGSARLGLFAGEWDPGWWMLMVLRALGLVWSIRLPAALPPRAELLACDASGAELLRHSCEIPPPIARVRLRDVLGWCWRRRVPCVMEGPAANLSASALRRMIGTNVPFHLSPEARRISVTVHEHRLQGLPALCVAVCRRSIVAWLVALCIAPFAVALENMREALDVT
jgi:stearoyl-CoA desaturase (delta-9 desaturase)